jgi:hypothetical protein
MYECVYDAQVAACFYVGKLQKKMRGEKVWWTGR